MIPALSLFAGIGGLDLALAPWCRTVAYCEQDDYCQTILRARMADERLHEGPIHDDIRTFPAAEYAGRVDLVHGGFPCQDVSVAGRGDGITGERSGLFFDLLAVARDVGARLVFLENVAALVVRGLDAVLGALAEGGWDAEWTTLRASDVGAPHRRDRWFCLAYRGGERRPGEAGSDLPGGVPGEERGAVADADDDRRGQVERRAGGSVEASRRDGARHGSETEKPGACLRGGGAVGDADGLREQQPRGGQPDERGRARDAGDAGDELHPWPPGPSDTDAWRRVLAVRPDLAPALPPVRRVADGTPDWLDGAYDEYRRRWSARAYTVGEPMPFAAFVREYAAAMQERRKRLRALGNAVVPAQARAAFAGLWERLHG